MSVGLMREALKEVRLSKAEETWFPRWFLLCAAMVLPVKIPNPGAEIPAADGSD